MMITGLLLPWIQKLAVQHFTLEVKNLLSNVFRLLLVMLENDFQVPHTTVEEVEIGGFILPKGTEVQSNLHAVHYDPVTWPEPEIFKPMRHLTLDGKIIKKEQLIPFSIGNLF